MSNNRPARKTHTGFYLLMILAIIRLLSMWLIPLNDSTEARYAEIARNMLVLHDWITPMLDAHTPFWGKPPLSFWLSAGSMSIFGINAFAARLPAFLVSLGALYYTYQLARSIAPKTASLVTLLLASNCFFFLNAGTVMTEPLLLFSITLAMWAFWQAMATKHGYYSLAFFTALGLGLLAKGPVAIVLIAGALIFWALWTQQVHRMLQQLHWFWGILWMLLISLPWYILAEHKTPGFLEYFIIGEHFGRYLQSGWSGDHYGYVHSVPRGTIWLYGLAAGLPWILFWRYAHKTILSLQTLHQNARRYYASFILFPLLFFTYAHNILYTYAFPIIPALALWFGAYCENKTTAYSPMLIATVSATCTGLLFVLASLLFVCWPQVLHTTEAPVVKAWRAQHPYAGATLYYWSPAPPPWSAIFYTEGHAASLHDETHLCTLGQHGHTDYLIVKQQDTLPAPACRNISIQAVKTIPSGKKSCRLMKIRRSDTPP